MQQLPSDHLQERRSSYQINRYPTALIDVWHMKGGERLTLRPVLPQDSKLLDNLIQGVSRKTRHNRFHGAVTSLSAADLKQMTCVDYRRHLAFVVTTVEDSREQVVADARYVVDEYGDGAEFALLVDDRWQRRGLGERAMRALAQSADRQGLTWLHGSVLSSNLPMLSLVQRCEFGCTPDREDEQMIHVERRLGKRQSAGKARREGQSPLRWLSARYNAIRSISLGRHHEA